MAIGVCWLSPDPERPSRPLTLTPNTLSHTSLPPPLPVRWERGLCALLSCSPLPLRGEKGWG